MVGVSQNLHLALHQTLSPQMRQSLEILQATTQELQQLVRRELELNPVLEEAEAPPEEGAAKDEGEAGSEGDGDEGLDELLRLDEDWRDFSTRGVAEAEDREEAEERQRFLLEQADQGETLTQHLLQQLPGLGLDEVDARVAHHLIASLDGHGRLTEGPEAVAASLGIPPARVREVLRAVQGLHPAGVAAADLRECLLLQLERDGRGRSLAADIVRDHLEALGRHRHDAIASALGVSRAAVLQAASVIAALDPAPARAFTGRAAVGVSPDLVIERVAGEWVVSLNQDELPHLRISRVYRDLLGDSATTPEVRGYVREKIRGGRFLLKCIQQRQQTMLAIGRELVALQEPFLLGGPPALQPMTMARLAEAIGVHETTVSRAVAGKFVAVPAGVFELRALFTAGYAAADGSMVSATGVKDQVAALIRAENPRRPLSDQQIMERLAEGGLVVARRTVAKYREELGLLPSHLRKAV